MNRGAYWAGRAIGEDAAEERAEAPPGLDPVVAFGVGTPIAADSDVEAPSRTGERLALAGFAAATVAWIAAAGYVALLGLRSGLEVSEIVRGVALASGPLALIAVLILLWQRNGAREASRFADAARGVRNEALALDTVLGLASRRLEDDRGAVAAQADRLVTLADAASARLREAGAELAREIAELDRQTRAFDESTGTARVDMGVMLADLPIAEGQVRALADELRGAGLTAHEQAQALQAAIDSFARRAREAEEAGAGAANRLAAQAARVANAGEAAAQGIGEAEARMSGSVDAVLARAAEAVEQTHSGVVSQSEAIDALIANASAKLAELADRAGDVIGGRIAAIAAEIDALGTLLTEREGGGDALVTRIRQGLSNLEARFAELDETGRARTERLGEALGALWAHAERTMASLNGGATATTTLINRTETLHAGVRAALADIDEALPQALGRLDRRIAASRSAIAEGAPAIEAMGARVDEASQAIAAAGADIETRRVALDTLTEGLAERLAAAGREAVALDEAVAHADAQAARLAGQTTPQLVDALVRVRETAGQAAERAREALAAIVPQSAAALGEAGRRALEAAMAETVEAQIARVSALGEDAARRARDAAQRIEQDLARIAETSASVDARIDAGRQEIEAADRDNLSQRTAHLVDALNVAGVEIARAIEAEPGDAAWAAYLKGDRGVFTRRAVRLLDGADARMVGRSYEEDAAFRELVNRYVRDFEALLRPVLAMRDGQALAVVMLSSEIGKLYVALAQGIERLRT